MTDAPAANLSGVIKFCCISFTLRNNDGKYESGKCRAVIDSTVAKAASRDCSVLKDTAFRDTSTS